MKGTAKRKKNVKVFKKGKGKTSRIHLHSGNHAYNAYMKTHKLPDGLDGTPRGKHDAKNKGTCNCGGCINKALEV